MKNVKRIAGILFLLCCTFAFAQAPQLMSYQAVVRNASGVLVANANVGVRISILQGSTSGTAVYSETHALATNENGLVTLQIGGGNVQSGNFSTIDWGSGTYFIKTETDPNGGTNYSISGTSQLLSVPYALYAANTKSQGKATIYLTGDITDAEAATRIAEEAGPNTENVYIIGTTALTTVSITGVNSLINLQVVENTALQSVSLNSVKAIYTSMEVTNQNPNFEISLQACTNISATININIAGTLNMAALTKINTKTLNISAKVLTVPALESVICNCETATFLSSMAVSLPSIQNLEGDNPRFITINETNFTFSAPLINLGIINSNTNVLSFQGTTINLPSLTHARRLTFTGNTMTQLTLPSLVSSELRITGCGALTSVSLPSLTTWMSSSQAGINNSSTISYNQNLSTLSFPALSYIDNSIVAYPALGIAGNAFSSATVNAILHQLLNVGPVYGVDLRLQHPPAPPTGQGIIDKQTLGAQGKNILTD